jgi:glycosyltransferase involved in cell wall biosynthesis
MKRVAIFRSVILPVSETFVRDQALALLDWSPVMVGFCKAEDGLPLPGMQCRLVRRGNRVLSAARMALGQPLPRLVRAIRELDVALVHVHFGTDAADIWPSVRATGLPMVVTLHGYDINVSRSWWEAGHGGLRGRTYPRRLLQMANSPAVQFVAVSEAIKLRAIEYGLPEDRIRVCYIGVNTERFRPGGLPLVERRRRILFIGRMVEKKAPLLMIRAFAGVRKRVPDAELVMIGGGPLLGKVRQLAAELRVPVVILGPCNPDQVVSQLREARVFCLPSVTAGNGDAEGFGLALLEAQASGVPVVTSARGGAMEGLIDGVTGDAVPERDLDQLICRLESWLLDDVRAAAASGAARREVLARFDIGHCVRALEDIYGATVNAAIESRWRQPT